jgi:CheY-like chemotaxis protein
MIHVLYVDDEPDQLQLGKLFLEQPGIMKIDTATSGQRALEMLDCSPYDAVISDFQMPEMDGIALLKHIRREKSYLPFVLFTGYGREEIFIEALKNGADFYFQKGGNPKFRFMELHNRLMVTVLKRDGRD